MHIPSAPLTIDAKGKSVYVFSDTHFNDTFEPARYEYLRHKIAQHDLIIINGDLWEYELVTYDQFLNSEWSKLVGDLVGKEVYYITGNHDLHPYVYPVGGLQDVGTEATVQTSDRVIYVSHGVDLNRLQIQHFFYKFNSRLKTKVYERILENRYRKYGFNIFEQISRFAIKSQVKKYRDRGDLVINAHTHYPTHRPELNYLNTGWVRYGGASGVSISKTGETKLIIEEY